jgi:hypothetical protein
MSYQPPYPVAPITPPTPPRPRSVTIAGTLMLIGAVVGIIGGTLTIIAGNSIGSNFIARAIAGGATAQEADRFADSVRASFTTVGAAAVLLGVLMAVLMFLVLRGSNAARISTWVLLAVSLCCGCGNGLIASAVSNLKDANLEGTDRATAQALGQALQDSLPSWFAVGGAGAACVQVLGYIAVAVLLALPASNAYFRKTPPPTVQEPMPPTA